MGEAAGKGPETHWKMLGNGQNQAREPQGRNRAGPSALEEMVGRTPTKRPHVAGHVAGDRNGRRGRRLSPWSATKLLMREGEAAGVQH